MAKSITEDHILPCIRLKEIEQEEICRHSTLFAGAGFKTYGAQAS
jgi:hypothetical protein